MQLRVLVTVLVLAASSAARADWLGAAASHDDRDGPIAVWSRDVLLVSRDDGATFTSLPMPVGHPRDVVVERSGALQVLGGTEHGEETRLSRVHPDGHVEALEVPGWISAIEVGGDTVVALLPYEAAVAIAQGDGPFVVRPVPRISGEALLSTEATLAVDRDGTAHVVDVEVSTCTSWDVLDWARTMTVDRAGHARSAALRVGFDDHVYPTRWSAAGRGWSYALDDEGALATLTASGARAVAGAPRELDERGSMPVVLAGNGALTLAQIGAHVVRVDGDRARTLAELPGDAALVDVDARGRPIALSGSALHRFSRRTAWSTLFVASASRP